MSDYSKQLAELDKVRQLVKRKDVSAISADLDNTDVDEFEGGIPGIAHIKYKCLRRSRLNITITTRDKRD